MAAKSPDTESDVFAGAGYNPPCDHPEHGTASPFHKDGGDSYYVRFSTGPCGHYEPGIVAVCSEWVKTIRGFGCHACGVRYAVADVITVLGPTRDFHFK